MSLVKVPSQAERRRGITAQDQHGRKWENVIEISTGEPCATWMPLFNAPWFPPPTAVKRDPTNNARLVIDYAMVLNRGKIAQKDYIMSLRAYAKQMPGVVDVEAVVNDPPPLLLDFVGPGPEPLQFAYAASIGNPWALGFDPKVPDWARALMPDKEAKLSDAFPNIRGSGRAKVPERKVQMEELSSEDAAAFAEMGSEAGIEGDPNARPRRADGKFAKSA